jgi:deoxyhypusine synthase
MSDAKAMTDPETFQSLLGNAAHWEFEIFLMLLFDGIIGAILWPFVKKHWEHHLAHDRKEKGVQ